MTYLFFIIVAAIFSPAFYLIFTCEPVLCSDKCVWKCVSCGRHVLIECRVCPYCHKGANNT